ncbi:MAG: hypothetical protein KatS3mg076_1523 [Candidatus Binatia bacterium]|nr:MAG: hypothetical protein KatS3mg076_1523 [Candidatus Binatia bacterium]
MTLEILRERGHPTEALRSKSWDEFTVPGSPPIDIVVTVCDQAAQEPCPLFPGRAVRAHWSIEDPAATEGTPDEVRAAFARAYEELERRVRRLVELPLETLSPEEAGQSISSIL